MPRIIAKDPKNRKQANRCYNNRGANPPRPRFLCHIPLIAEIGVEILLACMQV